MKNIYRMIFAPAMLLALSSLSCNRYTTPNSPEFIEDRRTTKESKYNLMGFPGDREIVTANVPAANDSLQESGNVVTLPEYVPDNVESKEVFAVQVFASKSSEEASDFEKSIAALFEEKIRIDYMPPYYKVRVGSCANLDEAEALLEKVKGMGFGNAWLVRTRTP